MSYSFQSLSSNTSDSSVAISLSCNVGRYLFDAPEGAQRTIVQGKAKLRGMNTIFLTSLRPEDCGGLSGMLFTLADRGTKEVTIVGPENTAAYISTMRNFLARDQMALKVVERSMDGSYDEIKPILEDDQFSFYAIASVPSDRSSPELFSSVKRFDEPLDSPEGSTTSQGKRKRSPSLSPTREANFVPEPTPSSKGFPYQRQPDYRSARHVSNILNRMFKSYTLKSSSPWPPAVSSPIEGKATEERFDPYMCSPLRPLHNNNTFLSYVVVGPEKRGKVDVKKADNLGVPRTRLGELTAGKTITVTSPSGEQRDVRPEEVLGQGVKATATVIAHCPSVEYIDGVVDAPIWRKWFGVEGDEVRPVHVMYHKAGIWEDERYQKWMAKFGKDVIHLTGDPKLANNHLNALSSALSTTSLSLIDPLVFRRAHSSPQPPHTLSESNILPILPLQKFDLLPARTTPALDTISLSGGITDPLSIGIERVTAFSEAELMDRFDKTIPAYTAKVRETRACVQALEDLRGEKQPGDDVVVTALGTGSSMPSKYRNVSSTHLEVPGHGGILLDAGEGTLGQLARLYGPKKAINVLSNLKCIFISHLHADHHSGLTSLLKFRTKHTTPNNHIVLIGSSRILTQLREVSDFSDVGLDRIRFIENWDLLDPPPPTNRPAPDLEEHLAYLESVTGLTQMNTVKVDHRGHSCFGSIVGHKDGWKIVYSGDTMPCDSLVEAGRDATLLIHEATLADDTVESVASIEKARLEAAAAGLPRPLAKTCFELARDKGHSTFSQAVDVGRRMRSRNTLLTHFSQRYPKNPLSTIAPVSPRASEDVKAFAASQTVALACDFVSVRIGDLWKMPHYNDAVSALYEEQDDEDDEGDSGAEESAVGKAAGRGGRKKAAQKQKGNGKGGGGGGGDGGGGETSKISQKQKQKQKKARLDAAFKTAD